MDIFVKTSNKSKDYKWFNAENSQIQFPSISNPNQLEKLVDTEFESLVLYRESRQLILAITALQTSRIDNRTRPIRNSLIWITDNDDEAKIRAIIYEYLTNKESLEKQIAKAITETPEIKIDYQKIKAIGNQNNSNIKQNSSQPDLDNKIGSFNSDKCKEELINEITSYSLPEKKDGLLIFITDSKSKENITKENPWRGLSSKISGGEWINIANEKKKSTSLKDSSDSDKSLKNNNKESKQSNLLSIVLAIVLIVSNVFWFYQYKDLNKRYDSLKDDFQPSKIKIEKLNNQLQKIISDNEEVNKALKVLIDAQIKLNNDINDEKEMTKVQKSLNDSVEKLNSSSKFDRSTKT